MSHGSAHALHGASDIGTSAAASCTEVRSTSVFWPSARALSFRKALMMPRDGAVGVSGRTVLVG